MNIGILIPTLREARGFINALGMKSTDTSRFVYQNSRTKVVLEICGIGIDNARNRTESIRGQNIELLILTGFCGGLTADLRPGDLVVDNQSCDRGLVDSLKRIAKARNIGFHVGAVYTSPTVLWRPEEKAKAGIESGAIAVDMEGDAVREVCRQRNIPFHSFRTVSDDFSQRLPRALRYVTSNGETNRQFWRALVCAPWDWPCVCRMLMTSRIAESNLGRILLDYVAAIG